MKIHLICQYYFPEIGAPQARLSEMGQFWVQAGHQVTIFTGFPNHPTGIIPKEYKQRLFCKERHEGVTIFRHWLYATANKGFFKKTLSHLSFMISIVVLSLFRGDRPDVIVVSSPTFFSVFSAWLMSKIRRVPFVFEVRDLWPGIFIELGVLKNRMMIQLLEGLELFLYRQARKVVTVTHGFRQNIVQRGIQSQKVHVITNGVDLDFFAQNNQIVDRQSLGIKEDCFVLLYIGAHGICQGLPSVIEAAKQSQMDVAFLFVGDGAVKDDLVKTAQECQLANVFFLPGQDRNAVPGFYRLADACLVPLKDSPGFQTFIPSKIFEILACGRPIIGAVAGEAAQILTNSGSAIVIPPENPACLLQSIQTLINDPQMAQTMGESGQAFVQAKYCRRKLAADYLHVLAEAIQPIESKPSHRQRLDQEPPKERKS